MKRYLVFLLVLLTLLSGLTLTTTRVAHANTSSCINSNGTNVLQGTIGGANYTISVPSNWNGTLVLYSHGYVFPGNPLVAPDSGDPDSRSTFAAGLCACWLILQPEWLGTSTGIP